MTASAVDGKGSLNLSILKRTPFRFRTGKKHKKHKVMMTALLLESTVANIATYSQILYTFDR
jgi:hypothetical protein